jgi:hypothetical protein
VSRDRSDQQPSAAVWDTIHTTSVDHECFADEITVDFPSVAPLVERERDAFLGAPKESSVLQTEISLSRQDAARGTVIPLEVPLRGTCLVCGGRGERWPEPCDSCAGTGESPMQHRVLLSVPPGVSDGARFRFRIRAPLSASVRVEVRVAVRRTAA